jgi:hypothetical protein
MKRCKILSFIVIVMLIIGLVPTIGFTAGTPIVEVTDIVEITSQGQGSDGVYQFPFGGVVVIKQGGNLWVWTMEILADDVKAAMQIALEELIGDSSNLLYGAGTIAGFVYGNSFEITKGGSGELLSLTLDENQKLVAKKSDLAKLFAGAYTVIYPPEFEYEWVLKSEKDDSCTGFINLDDKLIGNSWFRMQSITLPGEGESIDIGIVAGNPKNGANIVGTIKITNMGSNAYKATFSFINQNFPDNPNVGDTCQIIEVDKTMHWNYTGSGIAFDKAPGKNLKGSLDGVYFNTDKETIDFYAHFSITTGTYVYEQVVAEAE